MIGSYLITQSRRLIIPSMITGSHDILGLAVIDQYWEVKCPSRQPVFPSAYFGVHAVRVMELWKVHPVCIGLPHHFPP